MTPSSGEDAYERFLLKHLLKELFQKLLLCMKKKKLFNIFLFFNSFFSHGEFRFVSSGLCG